MISNLRDLGGIPAADGKRIKRGMLIRSASLAEAEERDLKGISTVIDLRTPAESEEEPDRCWGAEYLSIPSFDESAAGITRESGAPVTAVPEMSGLYRMAALTLAVPFSRTLKAIIGHDFSTGAVLWHCAGGKDRTGVITALVLMLLGIPREGIVEDYLRTNIEAVPKAEKLRSRLTAEKGVRFAEAVYRASIADESYINAALEVFDEEYMKGLGLDEYTVEDFRRTVLE